MGSYPAAGVSVASTGPDQEEEGALSCPVPTPAPRGHPNTQRRLEHSLPLPGLAKATGKECTVGSLGWGVGVELDPVICKPRQGVAEVRSQHLRSRHS